MMDYDLEDIINEKTVAELKLKSLIAVKEYVEASIEKSRTNMFTNKELKSFKDKIENTKHLIQLADFAIKMGQKFDKNEHTS